MAIVKMKKIRLVAVSTQKDEILRDLMLLGCVEISDPESSVADPEVAAIARRGDSNLSSARADYATLLASIKLLDKYAPAKSSLLAPKPAVTVEDLLCEDAFEENMNLANQILSLDEQIRKILAEESREKTVIESLHPWESMDVPLELEGTKSCDVFFGTVPPTADVRQIEVELDGLGSIEQISESEEQICLTAICLKAERDKALEILRSHGFSIMSFNGLAGTAKACIADAEQKIAVYQSEKDALVKQIAELASCRNDLKRSADMVFTRIAREETKGKMLCTDSTFIFEGWMTKPDEKKLEETLAKYDCAWETEDPDPEKPEEVPVKLKNNKLTEPYNVITEMYSLPAYNGLDPNPFVMPAFALFFGIMFADMAYGLIMMLVGLVFLKKARPSGTMKNLMGILVQCGLSTFIIGFLTGGFFGDAVSVVGGIFGKEWNLVPYLGTIRIGDAIAIDLPLNLLDGNNPLYVLILAMVIGVIHLAIGVGIGCYLKIRDGEWIDAILNDLSWWVMFVGIAVMVLKGTAIVIYIGIGMLVVGTVLTNKGLGRITGLFGAVYNGVTGYLGDILSYSRLMALMLAGSVIASVFNQLDALGGIVLFIPVAIIGHLLNFALNLIGCFVHTMRLQFLEFFGKWYREGGRPFQPLAVNTKFVDIKED